MEKSKKKKAKKKKAKMKNQKRWNQNEESKKDKILSPDNENRKLFLNERIFWEIELTFRMAAVNN